jgi:cytochrome P450
MADDSAVIPTNSYDHRDDISYRDPWPRWRQMREAGPIHFSELHGGFYALPRYREVVEAARATDVLSSADGTSIPPIAALREIPPIHVDPPAHRQWREFINPHLSPSKVDAYRPWISDLVAEVLDPLLASSGFDLPRDLGLPLTRRVILRVMGVADAPEELNEWTDDLVFGSEEAQGQASVQLTQFLAGEIQQRRQSPGDDLISAVLDNRLEGAAEPLGDPEILGLMLLVLLAALETTSSAISAAVCYLLDHPEDTARLTAEPQLLRTAVEEFVRWSSPAPCLGRTATRDVEIAGCPVSAGDKVMLLYGSANRDAAEFPQPDEVVLDRYPNRHVGFGIGPHRCAGSHIAKAQIALALERILPSLGHWRVEDPEKITWNSNVTRGMSSVPLVRR